MSAIREAGLDVALAKIDLVKAGNIPSSHRTEAEGSAARSREYDRDERMRLVILQTADVLSVGDLPPLVT
ncbi:hypothetical protein [Micromonospora sp. NPDC023888]|uniref:hypothetical protein n=1 Tax=Micromonospora sp. NPDC023888 TaxID=3155607 RepID=UPI003402CDB2